MGEQVYEMLLNTWQEKGDLSWVEPIFVPGNPCFSAYCDMLTAYEHLRTRLGTEEEDPDAEKMIHALLDYGKILALEMFRYGVIWEKMSGSMESDTH